MSPKTCYCCKRVFKTDDEVFVVANIMITDVDIDGWSLWRWISGKDKVEPINFFYHRECWSQVAGQEYLSKYKDEQMHD